MNWVFFSPDGLFLPEVFSGTRCPIPMPALETEFQGDRVNWRIHISKSRPGELAST
jgi:hypothetical protein